MNSRAKYRWLAAVGCTALIAAASLCVWRWASVSHRGGTPIAAAEQEQQVWVEACRPISVRQPLEVAGIGENGEKGLYCATGGGVAMENDGGDAAYRFHVPAAGRYKLWGYCRWLGAEGDGFIVTIGNARSAVRKSDAATQWQWLPLAEAELPAGVGRMTITTKGGGFAVRRLFLCNNLSRHPLQSYTEPGDIFLDDFDGCEEGEFDSWSRVSGQWTVHRRQDCRSPAAKLLVGKSSSEAMINVGSPDWREYSLTLDCRTVSTSPVATAAVRFCCDSEGSGLVLRWTPTGANGQVQMELLREEATGVKTLDGFAATWDTSKWSELSIEARDDAIAVSIDSLPIRTIKVDGLKGGAIGLWLSGGIEMMFDNIQVLGRRVRTAPATQEATQPANHNGNERQETSIPDDKDI